MNNEFEKNLENNNADDNTSGLTDSEHSEVKQENTYSVSDSTDSGFESVEAVGDICEISENIPEAEIDMQTDTTADEEANLASENSEENTETETETSDSQPIVIETRREENSCIPGSKTYLYSKTSDGEPSTVGCVWENSSDSSKEKHPKKKISGFRVFTAAMLSVFAVSTLTIAGFLALDYVQDKKADVAIKSEVSQSNDATKPPVYSGQTTLVSKFANVTNSLTKSQVATKCQPSAVGIVIEQEQTYNGYNYTIPFFGGFGYDFGIPGGTQIVQGSGSGFIYSADGYIITNHHVVDGASKITVYLHDGTTAEAELVGSDALSDIAVIKIDATDKVLVPMEIGDSSVMKVGDEVIAIGCPAGIEFMGTVTDGIISAINRDVELDNDGSSTTKTMTLLQTNATINRGNSGGPLINTSGQVIGINTLKLSADYEGIGFSIPMNGALPIISQLIEHGKVVERTESFVSSEGVIGISASEITEQESKYYDIPMGVLVVQIDKDSSASKAGLRRGDIITKFNGEDITTVNQLNKLKASFKAGDEVTVTVYRDSDEETDTFDITFRLDMAE